MEIVKKSPQWKINSLLLSQFLGILLLVIYILYSSYQMSIRHLHLVEASLKIQIELTTAHLWFEEIMSGDLNEDMMKDVWDHLDRARRYSLVIAEGGDDKQHHYVPLDDPELTLLVTGARSALAKFKSITEMRMKLQHKAKVGSEIEQEYDMVYHQVMKHAKDIHLLLQEKIEDRQVHFLYIGFALIMIIIIIFVVSFLKFRSYERDKSQSLQHRIESEKKLSESEAIFRGLFENISSGAAIYEAVNDGENFKFQNFNKTAESIEGVSREDLVGEVVTDVFPGITEFGLLEVFTRVYKTGEPEQHPISLYKDDSIIGWRENYVFKIPSGEIVAVYDDITEQKKAEESLQRLTVELEEKNRELEQIVYVTSHDLRSPLVNIQGFSNELRESLKDMRSQIQSGAADEKAIEMMKSIIDEDMGESIRFIISSTSKIDSLLSGLLQFSRLGRSNLNIQLIDMDTMITDILETMEYRIKKENIMIQREPLPSCFGDKNLLNQVFSNVLDNAIKFIEPDRAAVIKISGIVEGEHVIYYIEDNGIGIASEYHKKVFEIFHQLNPNKTDGIGLGMTIVRKILGRQNGTIRLASASGLGTKVSISMPLSDWNE